MFSNTQTVPWQEIASLPISRSTVVAFKGHVLAVGGCDIREMVASGDIFLYSEECDEWLIVGEIPTPRYKCLVEVANNELVVIGGWLDPYTQCNLVEVATLL